jgi:hypothetical protein
MPLHTPGDGDDQMTENFKCWWEAELVVLCTIAAIGGVRLKLLQVPHTVTLGSSNSTPSLSSPRKMKLTSTQTHASLFAVALLLLTVGQWKQLKRP